MKISYLNNPFNNDFNNFNIFFKQILAVLVILRSV